jgi:hypothetical protein
MGCSTQQMRVYNTLDDMASNSCQASGAGDKDDEEEDESEDAM